MIENCVNSDLNTLKEIIKISIVSSIINTEPEAGILIKSVIDSLLKWNDSAADGYYRKFKVDNEIVAFILIKEYWNLSHLFVLPSYQMQGIGKVLLLNGIESCKGKSQKKKIELNSSINAAGFYTRMGFVKAGEVRDLPGGCIPFEYCF
jgi:GNAT superfamily N-acetyltransferase